MFRYLQMRNQWTVILISSFVFASTLTARAAECVATTAELDTMQVRKIALTRKDAPVLYFPVKVADDTHERAAGFQHVCPEIVERIPILFVFSKPTQPWFHMQNVHAPLDIAFLDETGRITEIQHMSVYSSAAEKRGIKYYRPRAPISGALEAYLGFFDSLEVTTGNASINFRNQ